jgi:hypothetical protein
VLLTLAAVGGVIVLLGSTGLFAALSDTARSGTNYVDSGALSPSADLQIAAAQIEGSGIACGEFGENLESGVYSVVSAPGADGPIYFYCLRNIGSQTVDLSVAAENLTDFEMDCTGDEAEYDSDCGSGTGPGELSVFVNVSHQRLNCELGTVTADSVTLLRDTVLTPVSLGTLGPNEMSCFGVVIYQSSATDAQRQAAQSDRLLWQFAWTGQA